MEGEHEDRPGLGVLDTPILIRYVREGWFFAIGKPDGVGEYVARLWRPFREPALAGRKKEVYTGTGATPQAAVDRLSTRLP